MSIGFLLVLAIVAVLAFFIMHKMGAPQIVFWVVGGLLLLILLLPFLPIAGVDLNQRITP